MQQHTQRRRVPRTPAMALGLVLCALLASLFTPLSPAHAIASLATGSDFTYHFSVAGHLREAGAMAETSSPYWWVNSGGYMTLSKGEGRTAHGTVPIIDTWHVQYAAANPVDTDGGTHPQNLFRLVSRSTWDDVRLEAQYKIDADHFSSSPNRNASNGLLLMSRYGDAGQTLYYAGVRVDGTAVIKKKYKGTYTTLAQEKLYPGTYVEGGKVNLIPHNKWIGLRSETVTNGDGSVSIRLYVKNPGSTGYVKVLEAKDSNSPIVGAGYMGLRTDFMDVDFDNVRATRL